MLLYAHRRISIISLANLGPPLEVEVSNLIHGSPSMCGCMCFFIIMCALVRVSEGCSGVPTHLTYDYIIFWMLIFIFGTSG